MKILNLLAVLGLTTLISIFPLQSKISANDLTIFSFNKHSNHIWIGDIRVEQGVMKYQETGGIPGSRYGSSATTWRTVTGEAVKITGHFGIPRCPNRYHTEGSIVVKYTNDDAYVTRTFEINRQNEDKFVYPEWTVGGYYGDPDEGEVTIETTLECVCHSGCYEPSWPF